MQVSRSSRIVLPGMPATERLDTLPSCFPESGKGGVDGALGNGGNGVEIPTVRVLKEFSVENAPADTASVSAEFLVPAGAVVLTEAVIRLSRHATPPGMGLSSS